MYGQFLYNCLKIELPFLLSFSVGGIGYTISEMTSSVDAVVEKHTSIGKLLFYGPIYTTVETTVE